MTKKEFIRKCDTEYWGRMAIAALATGIATYNILVAGRFSMAKDVGVHCKDQEAMEGTKKEA